ncbi:MAG: T9SS type A sorting domain-containing protein [Bacteroidetes bacterium]|nr:T9SS type A sorting domain-containing protein [Bacteroidota bacterium]
MKFKSLLLLVAVFATSLMHAQNLQQDFFELKMKQMADAESCLSLYLSHQASAMGKSTAYRLIGTRSEESGSFIDSNQIKYSGQFANNPIPPMSELNTLSVGDLFAGTYYDTLINFTKDFTHPGQYVSNNTSGYTFNSQNQPLSYYSRFYTQQSRTLYSYNSSNQLENVVYQTLNGGNWIGNVKQEFTYATHKTEVLSLYYNSNTQTWDTSSRMSIWNDPTNHMDSSLTDGYLNGQWVHSQVTAHTYNADHQYTRTAKYQFELNSQTWIHLPVLYSSYNSNGDLITETLVDENKGMNLAKSRYIYSSNQLDSIVTSGWSSGNQSWIDTIRTSFSYNSGNLVKKETESKDRNASAWTPVNKLEFTSDVNGNASTSTYFVFINGQYNQGLKNYYYYESYINTAVSEPESAVLAVYPNPSTGNISLIAPYAGEAVLSIWDMSGRRIESRKLVLTENQKMNIPLNLSQGVYTLRLESDNTKSYTAKLSIQ